MAFGGGRGNLPDQPGWRSPSDPEDEAEQTFEFRRLAPDDYRPPAPDDYRPATPGDYRPPTSEDYRAQAGRTHPGAVQARATRAMRRRPAPRWGRIWLLALAIAVPVAAGVVIGLFVAHGSTPTPRTGTLEEHAPLARRPTNSTSTSTNSTTNANPGPAASADCPVGTSRTAVAIADALARDPVYAQPGSALLTATQARRLRAEIGRQDPGRIRIAAVSPATVRRGGGERALANAIASCPGTAQGTTLVTTSTSTYLVTSYANPQQASSAVAAALNTHISLAAGLMDAVRRVTIVDKHNR
jgi:hypothetical protein